MKNMWTGKTSKYSICSEFNGTFYTITRLADTASVFLQGDDADEFRHQLNDCKDHDSVDVLCSQYDEVMTH